MEEPLLTQYSKELEALANSTQSMANIKINALTAIAIIGQIQLASRHPDNKGLTAVIAREAAHQLQSLFVPESATAKVLEMGWYATFDFSPSAPDTSNIELLPPELMQQLIDGDVDEPVEEQ